MNNTNKPDEGKALIINGKEYQEVSPFWSWKLEASNCREDYKYIRISNSGGGRFVVEWLAKGAFSNPQGETFSTMKGAKTFVTQTLQNPKWGEKYPKIIWEEKT